MTDKKLHKKIAYLEFVNDQLETELKNLDILLKATGFPQGLESAKEVALQMIEEGFQE